MLSLLLVALLGAANVYEAAVVRVVDGDTVKVRVVIWLDQEVTTSIRVRAIDTPELKGKCAAERALAQQARAFTASLLPAGSTVLLVNVKPDKYGGRYDADIFVDGKLLSNLIVSAGLARTYAGGKRGGWCP